MLRFWHLSTWIGRAVLAFGLADYGFNAGITLFEPVLMAWNLGIGMWTTTAITATRVHFGFYPLAVAIIALYCLLSPGRFLAGIAILFLVSFAGLAGYALGLWVEGPSARSLLMLQRSLIDTTLYGMGLAIEFWRRTAAPPPAAAAVSA